MLILKRNVYIWLQYDAKLDMPIRKYASDLIKVSIVLLKVILHL